MVQIQLINSVIGWERMLEHNEERRKYRHPEPYVNYLAAPQTDRTEKARHKENQTTADLLQALRTNW